MTPAVERPEHHRRLLVALVAAVLALVVGVGVGVDAHTSSSTVEVAGSRVAAHDHPATVVVAASEDVRAGEGRGTTTRAPVLVSGSRVAPRATLSGRTVLGNSWDDAIRAGTQARPEAGFHDVVGHGTPTSMLDAAGRQLSAAEVAGIVRGTPSWGGQNIRLLSCSTGCPTGNFAQRLADDLGVAVRAPTADFYVNSRGIPVLDPGGRWIIYLPGGG